MGDADSGHERRSSSALARRSPAALKYAPTFFPSGHSEGWKVFTIAFGAPGAAGISGGLVGMALGLGVGALGLGAIAAPLGMWGANHLLSERGKRRLAQAQLRYRTDPPRGLVALQSIAASAALPDVRLEAAARVAIDQLSRGDIAAAIETLSIREQDIDRPRRRRSWEAGLRGELLRSILAWLSPGSFTEGGIAAAESFPDDAPDPEGVALLAALRVLELASRDDDGPLAAAWHDFEASGLAETIPTLHIIVHAVAAERLHHLLDELHERLREDRTGQHRDLLRRLFPGMQILVEGGYRASPPEAVSAGATSLAVVAPSSLMDIARPTNAELVPASRGAAATMFLSTYGIVGLSTMAFIGLAADSMLLGGIAGVFIALYFGTPIAAIMGSKATQRAERARRIAPLARLDPAPPTVWLTECASGPPGAVTRTSGYRRLSDIPRSQMALYAAAIKAEQAVERGDLEDAWNGVEWWFSGFTGKLAADDPLYAVGSSLVRIAALTGHRGDARRLLAVLAVVGNEWDGPANRTIYGNAPAAVALATALVGALDSEWDVVDAAMRRALEAPRVDMAAHDRSLIAEVVRRAGRQSAHPQWDSGQSSVALQRWLAKVWPPAERPTST